MRRPSAFLFDLDGTLIDSEGLWMEAIVGWLAESGVETSVAELAPMVCGRSWFDIHAMLHAAHPELPRSSPQADAAALRPHYGRLAKDPAKMIVRGTVDFMRKAAKIAPCAVVSGSPHEDVADAVELCGVADIVKLVLGVEDYGRGKPAPDGFLKAAALLDVDASECVVLEDSTAGVASGRAAGMRVVGIDRNAAARQDFTGCEWLVRDLSELDVDAVFGH